MISTLLFDLDDTLLGNDMDRFIPAYLQAFVEYLGLPDDGQRFVAEIMAGTQAMFQNADPARTLKAAFDARFFPALGWDKAEWSPRLEQFYQVRYPQLQSLTTARPLARAAIEWAVNSCLEVAITTNPLFPLFAIQERLRWAGLGDVHFALVTSYETSHFAKPHPRYFAEVLGKLGRRPDEVLVVGDDWKNDIRPAAALAIPCYWIAPAGSALPDDSAQPAGVGGLDDFLAWAREAIPDLSAPAHPPATALPHLLAGHLAAAVSALDGLPASAWTQRPGAGEWSPTEIVCHWRDVEMEVNAPRLRTVMNESNPFITAVDSDPWAVERNYQAQDGPLAFMDFIAARKQNCEFLESLPGGTWNRPARHSALGPTHLAEIVGWILDHDRLHLEQLRQTVEKARA